jgi:hypothetical protein
VTEIPTTIFAGSVFLGQDLLLLVGGEDANSVPTDRLSLVDASSELPEVTVFEHALRQTRRSALCVPFSSPGAEPAEALVVGGAAAPSEDDPGSFAERMVATQNQVFTLEPEFVINPMGNGLPVMHAAGTTLSPGRLLVSGGMFPGRFHSKDMPYVPTPLNLAGVVDMRTEVLRVMDAASQLGTPRAFHTSTKVDSRGHVLVAGGFVRRDPSRTILFEVCSEVEWWDDENEAFSLLWLRGSPVQMLQPRAGHTAIALPDGTVLMTGGTDGASILASSEIFNPLPVRLDPNRPPDL